MNFKRAGIRPAWILGGATLVAALALAACGGGGSATSPIPGAGTASNSGSSTGTGATGATTSTAGNGTAAMSFTIPAKAATASSVRTPAYISASTQSMTVSLAGKQIAEVDLTTSSGNCAAVSGGGTQCTVSFGVPAGQDVLSVNMYDATGGKGNLLSSASLQANITAGTTSTIPVVLSGVAASAAVITSVGSIPVGTTNTVTVGVQATDADGNVIIGPGTFSSPISVAITGDTWSTLSPASFSITAPGVTQTLTYSGKSLNSATLTPSATGLKATAAALSGSGYAVSVFQPDPGAQEWQPQAITALPDGSAAYLAQYNGCCGSSSTRILGLVNAGGNSSLYYGDTSDPMASPVPTATPTGPAPTPNPSAAPVFIPLPNYQLIHGMISPFNISDWWGPAASSMTVGGDGNVYFGGWFNHDDNIVGGFYYCGLGVIDAISPTAPNLVHQTLLKGEPYYMKTDATGAVWFIEYSGESETETSNGSGGITYGPYVPLLSGDGSTAEYALGKLNKDGTVAFETPFSKLGISISSNEFPGDFAIAPDGSAIYLAMWYAESIVKVPLSGGSPVNGAAQTALVPDGASPSAMAVGNDGSVLFQTNFEPANYYYYGYIPAGAALLYSISGNSIQMIPFNTTSQVWGSSIFWTDGSYWLANDETNGCCTPATPAGLARITPTATSSSTNIPQETYILTQSVGSKNSYNCGAAPGGGVIWVSECAVGSLVRVVYGAQSSGSVANAAARAAATSVRMLTTFTPSGTSHLFMNHMKSTHKALTGQARILGPHAKGT